MNNWVHVFIFGNPNVSQSNIISNLLCTRIDDSSVIATQRKREGKGTGKFSTGTRTFFAQTTVTYPCYKNELVRYQLVQPKYL